ncbi:hypothetical protein [Azohydromonas australica]|uniref:hypothetical protein n=1 Tax=Azohydromonas australica TaxID=364039 RepID=UPI0012EC1EC5|nr:hypothetical protein [Azohydromonas australica]
MQRFDGLQLRKAAIGQPVLGHMAVALHELLVHGSHLSHVAAAVAPDHRGDELCGHIHDEPAPER